MPTTTGNKATEGLPDSDFAGTSPALEDLVSPEDFNKLINEQAQAPPATPPAEQFPCQKTIDLGDGKGVQVFKGKSWEEVSDKLVEAQRHATAKIRELTSRAPNGNQPESKPLFQSVEYKPQPLTRAEQLQIAELLDENPERGFDELIKKRLGADPQAIANGLNIMQTLYRDKLEQNATSAWAQRHSGEYWQYDLVPALQKIAQKLLGGGYPITENNLEWSYSHLVAAGELMVNEPAEELPPPPPPPASPPAEAKTISRSPAPPAFVVSDRSGQRTEATTRREGVDVAALNKLTLADMRDAINTRLKQG
jgi:hypothetical protein